MNTRHEIISALEREIVGPSPNPVYLDPETGEELLLSRVHGTPKGRYGGGMLYPQSTLNLGQADTEGLEVTSDEQGEEGTDLLSSGPDSFEGAEDRDEEPVGLANQFFPSAMGMTARFSTSQPDAKLKVEISSAFYRRGTGQTAIFKRDAEGNTSAATTRDGRPITSAYATRVPLNISPVILNLSELKGRGQVFCDILHRNDATPWLSLKVFNRTSASEEAQQLITLTIVIINEIGPTNGVSADDWFILYQNKISIFALDNNIIMPYQERVSSTDTADERQMMLLYRKKRMFAIGHGAAVKWDGEGESVKMLSTFTLPVYEMPQVAPSGDVELSMLELSDIGNWETGVQSLQQMVASYSEWIKDMEEQAALLNGDYLLAAETNIAECKRCLDRIDSGVKLLVDPDSAELRKAFRWMNWVMLWQQQRSKAAQRKWETIGTGSAAVLQLEGIATSGQREFADLTAFHGESPYNARWRPFQLAFILMNLRSALGNCPERETVDLIWFPTGGGKTEAYLGLSALTIFIRRLKGLEDLDWEKYSGTTILMRYTLRLLTAQQYERASSLICGCELVRTQKAQCMELGDQPISIGLWVGGTSTPNKNKEGDGSAVTQFNNLNNAQKGNAPYNFIVMKCPCCAAQIGKLDRPTPAQRVVGLYREDGIDGRVLFRCENRHCEFFGRDLPLFVVDEHIYQQCPTLVLGTVDKFAMLPWKKDAGSIFGFRAQVDGYSRICPPELIIQDELHLISGPLGTMVGLYEILVQSLCMDLNREEAPFLVSERNDMVPPKIIASSATISRAAEQVSALYGTKDLMIFPPQGLDFGNTWFSKEVPASDANPGRMYVGVLGSGYPSTLSSVVRAYSAVLQKIKELENNDDIDYYWTLLGYFNSIRELGNVSSLVNADIVERLGQVQSRELIAAGNRRRLYRSEELTSRISASEIPLALKKLERNFSLTGNGSLDICLATNMVATGVDISRLGLMFVHGQPKTTAEYIQASSRVGRDVKKGPGLIFTLYNSSKPRDKSLYENFIGFHKRIYSYVEPTSVTPFSVNARQKGLHAVFIALVRHFSQHQLHFHATTQDTDFENVAAIARGLILDRCRFVDPEEYEDTALQLEDIYLKWKDNFSSYGDAMNSGILRNPDFYPLMYASGAEVRYEAKSRSFATPTSMRGIDSESIVNIINNN
ncbi:helicase-related protein [Pedobacter sp. MC2016-05]|uniref:helicase-related protein n=1 Tax=Pedobacter sp. MC2016-05 TaxID=2994474 RepID=UPI00224860A8|nr:helicase-related protein [Pedobacter sp. MC2016-05]MCX2476087.1 helicase-related protein [Pedobacter sp. MC2016-05]